MLEEKIVELTEAIKELTLWVRLAHQKAIEKSNDSTPTEKPVEKEPKIRKPYERKRRTKKEIEAEKTIAKIEVEQGAVIDTTQLDAPVEEALVEVTYDMVKNAAKALVAVGPGGPGLAKAAAIRDKFGYTQLADADPKDFRAIESELQEAVKTWGK